MSVIPEIVHTLNNLQSRISSVMDTSTAVMLVSETELLSSGSNEQLIHMNPYLLPPIQEYTMFPSSSNERTFMGHRINNDFIYEPTHSSNVGIRSEFHLIGDPGMFLVGPRLYITNQNLYPTFKTVIDLTVSANGTDLGEFPIILQGNQKEHIFLCQGDNFRVRYDPNMNLDITGSLQIFAFSEFTITRISRNPDYTSPFVYLDS
jgi:hypothetical protein